MKYLSSIDTVIRNTIYVYLGGILISVKLSVNRNGPKIIEVCNMLWHHSFIKCRPITIGVRDGGAGGAAAPPIRAVCRHEFGQRVDIIRAKHNTCVKNTNLGSVTAVNGKKTRI